MEDGQAYYSVQDIKEEYFSDYPELSSYDCPDLLHLDATNAPEFTRRLSFVIRQKLSKSQGVNQ